MPACKGRVTSAPIAPMSAENRKTSCANSTFFSDQPSHTEK